MKIEKLHCPNPVSDPEVITLGHGSGGLLTNRLLDSKVFEILKNEFLENADDAAEIQLEGKSIMSTDSFVVSPIFFPGGNIGELAVNGTVNDVAMCGGIPKYLSLSFVLEEGLTMQEFEKILLGIKAACDRSGVKVITGDTKVVDKGKGDKLFVNTTGIGELHPRANLSHNRIEPGDSVIISGEMANHGVAILSVREGLEFDTDLESDTANLNHLVHDLLDRFGDKIKFMRDPTRGGLSSTLNEVAHKTELGIEILEERIPVKKQVQAACEMLGLDPLYVANEGIFMLICDPEYETEIANWLRSSELGKNASSIGSITRDHKKTVVLNGKFGGRRTVQMMVGEQLPRIC